MKTAVIYARYSCEKQTEQSIEGQLRVCHEYASRNDFVIADIYIDRAMSGTNDHRTDFQRMLKDSVKRAWDYVLVYKLDRFSRNKYETAMHKKTLRDNGIRLISATENIPDTPEGIILESLLEGMAEYYSAELSQKVKRGFRESREKGFFTGGHLLFGYQVQDKKIMVHPDEAQIVRKIFEDCASGKMVKTTIQELHEMGVLCRGKPFARSTLYRLLGNEKYAGICRYDGQVFTNIYPQIIPDSLFSLVKNKLVSNKYGKHPPDVYYLLKNKLICGYCEKSVQSEAGTSQNGAVMRYYKCSGKKREFMNCELRPIRKEELEKMVLDATYEALEEDQISKIADGILEAYKKQEEDQTLVRILEQELRDTERGIQNLLKALENGIVTDSTKERLEQLEKRKGELLEKLHIERAREKLQITKEEIVKYLSTAIRKGPRLLVDLLIRKVVLWNDRIEIFYRYKGKGGPDDDCRQALPFYHCTKSFEVDFQRIGRDPFVLTYSLELFI